MATSGTIFSPYANHSRFYLSWQLAQQDIANNRSLVNWQVGLQITNNAFWLSNAVKINSIHIDGGNSLGSGTWSNVSGNGNHQLKSGSKWINHSSNGAKSFSAVLSGWLWGEGNRTASGTWELPTIPRNSQVSTNKSSYTLGEAIQIITNRKSSSFTHRIRIRQSNSGGTLIKQINNVGASTTWTPSAGEITTMQNMIPNSNKLTLYIESYNNQVKQSSNVSRVLTLTDANPTFEDFSFKDSDALTVSITGDDSVLIKGKSVLQVDIPAEDKMTSVKGASEDRYSIAFGGVSEIENYSDDSTVTASFTNVDTIGNRTIQVIAYDSRNNATSVTKDVVVYDYSAPTIDVTLTRENNFGDDTTISLEGTYSPLVIGGNAKNAPKANTLEYRYKEDGDSFGSWTTISFTDNNDGTYDITPFVVSLDNTKKYIFEFHIDDEFGTVTTEKTVDVGTPIMFVGQNSGSAAVGINKMPENGALDVDGDIYSNGIKVPTASLRPIISGDTITTYAGDRVSTSSGARQTVFDLTGAYEIVSGVFFGISVGMRLTVDGIVVINTTEQYGGATNNADVYSGALAVPPARSETSMKLEIQNTSGGTRGLGWIVYVRDV